MQSITPVRPEVAAGKQGLNRDRLCRINDELAAVAPEKHLFSSTRRCWPIENGDQKAEYAQPDGHLKPEGPTAWWITCAATP